MYHTVLFDLDGTLTDPGLGITNSVAYALKKWNIEVEDRTTLYKFIGPPLQESFAKYYGLSEQDSWKAIEYFREYFEEKGIFENEVYPGIPELLKALKELGKQVIVATSKPELYAVQILEHFHLKPYFDFVAGASMDEVRVKKADVIDYALQSCNIHDLSQVVMIGDREHDVLGAKAIGVDSIGVLFGYGGREELETAGADYLAEKPSDILNWVN